MRRAPLLLTLLLTPLLTLGPALAWAEEEPPTPVPQEEVPQPEAPKPIQVAFGLEHLVPMGGSYPDGWKGDAAAAPAGAPSKDLLLAIAKGVGIEDLRAHARCVPLMRGEGEGAARGVAAWIAIDTLADTFTPKLKAAAEKHGWLLKDVAVPQRVLVTWADSAEAAQTIQAWQVETAVRSLCEKGWAKITAAGQAFDQSERRPLLVQAQAMIRAAGAVEPRAGIFNAMLAGLLAQQDPAGALEANRKALKKDAPIPAPDLWIVNAAFGAGQGLLLKADDSLLAEVLVILERGVAAEQSAAQPFMRFGNRYNLACAYARLGKLDEAFKHLEESLRYLRKAWSEDKEKSFSGVSQLEYPRHFEHAQKIDTDLEPLRKDARWAPLLASYDPDPKPPAAEPKPPAAGPKKDDEGDDTDKEGRDK